MPSLMNIQGHRVVASQMTSQSTSQRRSPHSGSNALSQRPTFSPGAPTFTSFPTPDTSSFPSSSHSPYSPPATWGYSNAHPSYYQVPGPSQPVYAGSYSYPSPTYVSYPDPRLSQPLPSNHLVPLPPSSYAPLSSPHPSESRSSPYYPVYPSTNSRYDPSSRSIQMSPNDMIGITSDSPASVDAAFLSEKRDCDGQSRDFSPVPPGPPQLKMVDHSPAPFSPPAAAPASPTFSTLGRPSPPRHSRDMYATIPLPEVDDDEPSVVSDLGLGGLRRFSPRDY